MKICIAGKNDIAVRVLDLALTQLPAADIGVLPNDYVPQRHDWQLSLRQAAHERGIQLMTLEQCYTEPDLLFLSVEYSDLVVPSRFASPNLVNIHFSNLPSYKGIHTSVWPLRHGEPRGGVTLHRIAPGVDTGDIIAQQLFPIAENDTSRELYFNYMHYGYELIAAQFAHLLRGDYAATPQAVVHSSYFSRQSMDYNQIRVSFRATAWQVHNYVRSVCFAEYQLPQALGHTLRGSLLTELPSVGKPGTVAKEDAQCLWVNTIDYQICLLKDYSQALFAAIERDDEALVIQLTPLVHDVNRTNRQGWSALMVAAYRHQAQSVGALLEAGANLHQTNRQGTSVLMYAKDGALQHANDVRLLQTLLACGADPYARDNSGRTVLDYCRTNDNSELVDFFAAQP